MDRIIILVLVVLSQSARVPFSAVEQKVQLWVELLSKGGVIVLQKKKSVQGRCCHAIARFS